jgi:hypothetical protein
LCLIHPALKIVLSKRAQGAKMARPRFNSRLGRIPGITIFILDGAAFGGVWVCDKAVGSERSDTALSNFWNQWFAR